MAGCRLGGCCFSLPPGRSLSPGGSLASGAAAVFQTVGRLGWQSLQYVTQVGERVDVQVLAGRREAEEDRRRLVALVAARRQPVDPAHADQLQRPFADVVVDMQVAVAGVARRRRWCSASGPPTG